MARQENGTSLNVYTTSHLLRQTSLYVLHQGDLFAGLIGHFVCFVVLQLKYLWLLDRILEVAISLACWEVNLRWPSTGCRQIYTTEWRVWIWFKWDCVVMQIVLWILKVVCTLYHTSCQNMHHNKNKHCVCVLGGGGEGCGDHEILAELLFILLWTVIDSESEKKQKNTF